MQDTYCKNKWFLTSLYLVFCTYYVLLLHVHEAHIS